jgi:hypothetical protein
MNRKTFICFLFFLAFFLKIYSFDFHVKKCARHAIAYEAANGRLGDCLLSYINARYLSFVTSTKFIYKKFNHFDKFELSCLGHSFEAVLKK